MTQEEFRAGIKRRIESLRAELQLLQALEAKYSDNGEWGPPMSVPPVKRAAAVEKKTTGTDTAGRVARGTGPRAKVREFLMTRPRATRDEILAYAKKHAHSSVDVTAGVKGALNDGRFVRRVGQYYELVDAPAVTKETASPIEEDSAAPPPPAAEDIGDRIDRVANGLVRNRPRTSDAISD